MRNGSERLRRTTLGGEIEFGAGFLEETEQGVLGGFAFLLFSVNFGLHAADHLLEHLQQGFFGLLRDLLLLEDGSIEFLDVLGCLLDELLMVLAAF